jgi:hypothetical protein
VTQPRSRSCSPAWCALLPALFRPTRVWQAGRESERAREREAREGRQITIPSTSTRTLAHASSAFSPDSKKNGGALPCTLALPYALALPPGAPAPHLPLLYSSQT